MSKKTKVFLAPLFIMLMIMVSTMGFSQKKCKAGFTYKVDGLKVYFYDSSYAEKGIKGRLWSFGNGKSSDVKNPIVEYTTGGDYLVTLVIKDSALSCFDTFKVQIRLTNPNGTTKPCKAAFSYMIDGLTVYFYDNSTATKGVKYRLWNFGNGKQSDSKNPVHVYGAYGEYVVKLIIKDSAASCMDTVSITIKLKACDADFAWGTNGKDLYLKNLSSSKDSATKYEWSFGDGTGSKDFNPTHTYKTNGKYKICLYLISKDCKDVLCKEVEVNDKPNTFGYQISGQVALDNGVVVDEAMVYLIQYNPADSMMKAIDSFNITQSDSTKQYGYIFDVKEGIYAVKAALLKASKYYADYLPTYHQSSLGWGKATKLYVDSANGQYYFAPIDMIEGKNPGGPGSINGKVIQGLTKQGDPIQGITVLVTKEDGTAMGYAYSDENGLFSFPSLPYGKYKLFADVYGKTPEEFSITLSATEPDFFGVEVTVDAKTVRAAKTSIYQVSILNHSLKLYPNPAQDKLNVYVTALKEEVVMPYKVISITGATVQEGQLKNNSSIALPVGVKGMMLLQLQTKEGVVLRKFSIQE